MRVFPIVNSILKLADQYQVVITHQKLHKLLFILNGRYMTVTNEKLLHEPFEVWPYGPINRTLFEKLNYLGDQQITDFILEWDPVLEANKAFLVSPEIKIFHDVLKNVWNKYHHYTVDELGTLLRRENSPWYTAKEKKQLIIDDKITKDYFLKLADNVVYLEFSTDK